QLVVPRRLPRGEARAVEGFLLKVAVRFALEDEGRDVKVGASRPVCDPSVVQDLLVGELEASESRKVSRREGFQDRVAQDSLADRTGVEEVRGVDLAGLDHIDSADDEGALGEPAQSVEIDDRDAFTGGEGLDLLVGGGDGPGDLLREGL